MLKNLKNKGYAAFLAVCVVYVLAVLVEVALVAARHGQGAR